MKAVGGGIGGMTTKAVVFPTARLVIDLGAETGTVVRLSAFCPGAAWREACRDGKNTACVEEK